MSTPGDTGAAPDPVAALLAAEAATRSGTEGTAGRAADGRATERGGRSSGKERSSASRSPRRADGDAGESGSPTAGEPVRRLLAGVLLPVAALGLAAAGLLVRVPDGTTATAWVTAALIAAWAACGAATSWAPERTPQWQQAAGAVLGAVALGADRLSARFAAEAAHGPHRLAVAAGMVAAALMVAVSVHLLLSLPDGRLRSRGRLACALTAYGTALAAGGALAAAGQEIPAWLAVLIWTLALPVVFPAARNRYDHAAGSVCSGQRSARSPAVAWCSPPPC